MRRSADRVRGSLELSLSRSRRVFALPGNLNDPKVNTNLHCAVRVDELTFQYQGEIVGVKTAALEDVASMDRNDAFYFVSTRS